MPRISWTSKVTKDEEASNRINNTSVDILREKQHNIPVNGTREKREDFGQPGLATSSHKPAERTKMCMRNKRCVPSRSLENQCTQRSARGWKK